MCGDFPMQPWWRTRRHLGPAVRGTGPLIISVKHTVCCVYLNSREWITPGIRTQLRAIGPIGLSPALTAPMKLSTPNHKKYQSIERLNYTYVINLWKDYLCIAKKMDMLYTVGNCCSLGVPANCLLRTKISRKESLISGGQFYKF